MDHQLSFADSEFTNKRRQTHKEKFLGRMEKLIPWSRLIAVIESHYPKAGNGRRPYPLNTMLRIHCMQHWYNLSDPAMEDVLCEIASMRLFAGLSLDKAIPDHTTIMNFRHLLERRGLSRKIFEEVSFWLSEAGVLVKEGTLMDATIIEAPCSTKRIICLTAKRDTSLLMPVTTERKNGQRSSIMNSTGTLHSRPARSEG
jgi:IS5 family transposase